MKPADYLATHAVFRLEDFASWYERDGRHQRGSTLAVLKQHVSAGNLLRVRRGIYAQVLRGVPPDRAVVDAYVLTTHLAPDSVVAYHAALQYHGKAHSVSRRYPFLTRTYVKPLAFRGNEFVPVQVAPALRSLPQWGGGIVENVRDGAPVRVTTLERTLVDVLDAPRHGGGWEEVWRSLESVEFFDLDAVTDYVLALDSAVAVAKVGFYLEQHREQLMVEDRHLERLRPRAPAQPVYLERGKRESGRLQAGWNLVVPERVLMRTWADVA
jgi:predicted transcriptional regulator of viral defense system